MKLNIDKINELKYYKGKWDLSFEKDKLLIERFES